VQFTVACDLKVANLLAGVQAHGSKHPCCWCNAKKGALDQCGELRTIGRITEKAAEFQAAGSIRTTAKNFENCVHPPIIEGPDNMVVLDAICPGELHILLGVAKRICDEILVAWPPLEVESADSQGSSIDLPDDDESRLGAMAWFQKLHVSKKAYMGGQYTGNDCRKVIRNGKLLEELSIAASQEQMDKFVLVIQTLDSVVSACFGTVLDLDYADKIDIFYEAWLLLEIPAFPKLHVLIHHVPETCRPTGLPLGIFSE
jgi:hypothetical protein